MATDQTFSVWHVVFEADCNLRCTYCTTAHGTHNRSRGYMDRKVWEPWIQFPLEHACQSAPVSFEFGCGETFIHFDELIALADHLHKKASTAKIPFNIVISTNGTLLNTNRIKQLVNRHIALVFSIDGSEEIHNRHRKTRYGKGSYDAALNNWRFYNSLISTPESPSAGTVQSVYTGLIELAEMVRFWTDQNQTLFNLMVQLPRNNARSEEVEAWRTRQRAFLKELEAYAFTMAKQSNVPAFLTDYRGPDDLYMMWKRLFLDQKAQPCEVGEKIIAVDINGDLYPCEGFIGYSAQKIGDVFTGLATERLELFRNEKAAAFSICKDCSEVAVCAKGCVSAFPEKSMAESFRTWCSFGRQLTQIAKRSYRALLTS